MFAIIKLIVIALPLLDARITTLDGQTVAGSMTALNATEIVVQTADGTSSMLPLKDVVDVTMVAKNLISDADATNRLEIALIDGSVVRTDAVSASAQSVTGVSEVSGQVSMSREVVRAVRLQELKAEWRAEWAAFQERSNSKDVLVVLKRDGPGLDFLSGVVSSIGAEEVPFLLDGDEIPVPRSRVFGVVFATTDNAAGQLSGSAIVKLDDASIIRTSSIRLDGHHLKLSASWGESLTVPLERLRGIDFTSGRLHYLSDLEPISERYFGLNPPDRSWGKLFQEDLSTRTGLSSQWRMSRDRFPNSGRPPLSLQNQTYRKGLCIFPSAAIQYALDGRYTRLTAMIGVDDEVAFNQRTGVPATAVELRIEADGQEVMRQLVTATEAPFPLDLDVRNVSTLNLIVDFGDGDSTCDYLDLADARLLVDTSKE